MIEVRLRRVEIAHVGNFNIPTNVSRVDHRLTHGWNVRFLSRGQRSSKFFSDNLLGGPRKSFRAACAYATEHHPPWGRSETPVCRDAQHGHPRAARRSLAKWATAAG